MTEDNCTVKICICGHFECDHKGFYWFHATHCNQECGCEKFTLKKEIPVGSWDNDDYKIAMENF